jgi:integrative and conjugative element protein (TIGR02256 family)
MSCPRTPNAPIIETIWLAKALIDQLRALAGKHYPNEVGGILAGYINGNGAVVTEVVGPGPLAEHRPQTFLPDHAFHTEEMTRIFKQSEGRSTYLGDWHSHPVGPPSLSPLDKRTLRAIADSPGAFCPDPLMVLVSDVKVSWDVRAFNLVQPSKGRSHRVRETHVVVY